MSARKNPARKDIPKGTRLPAVPLLIDVALSAYRGAAESRDEHAIGAAYEKLSEEVRVALWQAAESGRNEALRAATAKASKPAKARARSVRAPRVPGTPPGKQGKRGAS